MADAQEFVEKRKHPRFKVKDRSFAVLGPDAARLCHMIDISRTGLAFRYFVDTDESQGGIMKLGILFGNDFYLENIPVRIVADTVVESFSPFNAAIMKRRGVEFGVLNSWQEKEIDFFIDNNTEGRV